MIGEDKPSRPLTPWAKGGLVLFAGGIVAALFVEDWRYLVVGFVAMVLVSVLGPIGDET